MMEILHIDILSLNYKYTTSKKLILQSLLISNLLLKILI